MAMWPRAAVSGLFEHPVTVTKLSPVDASRAKLLTSELNGRMVDACLQLHGGAGYMEEYEICRLYEDERVHRILAGTSEIMKEIIARATLDG